MKVILIVIFSVLVFLILAVWFAIYNIAPYGIISMIRHTDTTLKLLIGSKIYPADFNLSAENLDVTVEDSLTMKGWYIPAKEISNSTVIMLHGVQACRAEMLPTAKVLSEQGFNVVLFDSRGHGKSGGKYCTYGYYEKQDISAIVTYLLKRDSTQNIGIYGNSLGGAIALQAMAYDQRIKCGVVESTFSNLREVVNEYMKRLFLIGPRFISDIALNKAAEIAHFNPDEVQPQESAKRIINPVFMAHGDKDIHIKLSHGERNFNNLHSSNKEFHLIKGAGHFNLHTIGGDQYFQKVLNFLHRNLE